MTDALTTAESNKNLITEALRDLGLATQGGDQQWGRAKINGTTLDLDGNVFTGSSEELTLYGRLLDVPLEYQAVWLEPADAATLGRPDAAEKFCKSYYHIPDQKGEMAEDGTSCKTCPISPFIKRENSPLEGGKKCSWRADIIFHWTDKMGQKQDDRDWTLSLATTSVIEMKGTSRDPVSGFVSSENFMHRLAKFGIGVFKDDDPKTAIAKIGAMLKSGRLITSFKVVTKTGGPRNFPVIVMEPVNVILDEAEGDAPQQLAAEAASDAAANEFDDLPF